MKNIPAFLVLALFFVTSCKEIPSDLAQSNKLRLIWNDDPSTTMTIAWDQQGADSAIVYYGKKDHGRAFWKYKNQQTAQNIHQQYKMNSHFAKLSGLDAGQSYYFVIHDSKGVSERYWFKTAPDTPEPFTFIVGGDTKSGGNALRAGQESNKAVAILRPLFVVFNGDFTSGDGTNPEWWHQWLHDWQEITVCNDNRIIPIIPVHGNHENGNKANLSYIFNAPFKNNDSTQIYYSLNVGGSLLHLMALNSEIEEGGKQKEWIEEDLKKHESSVFKLAAFHKPFRPHTSRKGEQDYQLEQWAFLFDQHDLSIGLDADAHVSKITFPVRPDTTAADSLMDFVRDDVAGTMYVGEGSWGAAPRPVDDDKPWTYTSGSFNQVKWFHVFPESDSSEAMIKIHTVKTAENIDGIQVLYMDSVKALTEENLFDIPENITLDIFPDGKTHVVYPFTLN